MERDGNTNCGCFRIFKGALVVVLSLVVLTGIFVVLIGMKKARLNRRFCQKDDCKERAINMKQNMDTSVDPCKDFYNFTCGNYKSEYVGSPNVVLTAHEKLYQRYLDTVLSGNPKFILPEHTLREFHNACINIRTHSSKKNYKKDLRNILIGLQWPPLTKNWNSGAVKFNWLALEEKLIKMGFTNSLLTLNFRSMDDDRQIIVCQCCESMIVSGFSGGLPEEELKSTITEIVRGAIRLLEGDEELTNEIVQMFIKIEKIKKNIKSKMLYQDTSTLNNRKPPITLGELEKQWNIKFVKFCSSILPSYMNIAKSTNITFTNDCPYRLVNFLKQINKRPFAGYMLIEGIINLFWIINEETRKINQQYRKILQNASTESDHKECYVHNMQLLPDLWNYLYLKRYSTKKRKEKVLKMLHLILDEGKALINNSWLSNPSKKVMYNKLSKLKFLVDYDEKFVSDEYFQSTFGNLKFNTSDIMKSVLHLKAHLFQRQWKMLLFNAEERLIFATHFTPTINAYNDRLTNMLIIPAPVIKPMLYSDDFEDSLNFGGLGSIIAHEIFHTVDHGALRIDDNLKFAPWLNQRDKPSFDARINCFVKQYSNYKLTPELHVDGNRTINENLADSGKILAYRAYLKWLETNKVKKLPGFGKYNDRQIFWIALGSMDCETYTKEYLESNFVKYEIHAIERFRVLGTLSNFEEFSKDFNCPVNSVMNPKTKCKLYH